MKTTLRTLYLGAVNLFTPLCYWQITGSLKFLMRTTSVTVPKA